MEKQLLRATYVLIVIAALGIAGSARTASAVDFGFENPPYSSGSLLGQAGWETAPYVLADPFFGGAINGDVSITTTNPLAGAQSVLYNQAVAIGGNTGASDVRNPGALVAREHGSGLNDISSSFLIQTNDNSVGLPNNGSMGYFIGQGGRSPILVLLVNAGPTSGDILVGENFALPDVGNFIGNDVLEFFVGVDLDNQNYDVSVRNITQGTPVTTLTGSGPGGRFPFFGGTIGDDGDGITYTLDTSLLLRSGVGRIDDLSATAVPEPAAVCMALVALGAVATYRRVRG